MQRVRKEEDKGMCWGEIRWPVTQQCSSAVGKASAAGPGGKVAQRKSAGTAAPARRLGRPQPGCWLRQPSGLLGSGFHPW